MADQNPLFQLAFDLVNYTSEHLFLTGEAGTGKTTFLHYLKKHTAKNFAVGAPTGVAAINAGGSTLHSLFMLPVGGVYVPDKAANHFAEELPFQVFDKHTLVSSMRMAMPKRKMIQALELLIIDEVSMLRADTLDMIDTILRAVRRNAKPYGGVQVLFIGDLFQLDPVAKGLEGSVLEQYYPSNLFIDARVVKAAPPQFIELKKVYRQSDEHFLQMLNKVRRNRLDDDTIYALNERLIRIDDKEDIITITSHNHLAETINRQALEKIDEPVYCFKAKVDGKFPESGFPVDSELLLKTGAKVMFVKNDVSGQQQYFNGKIGRVIAIHQEEEEVVVQCEDEDQTITVSRSTWENKRYRYDEEQKAVHEEMIGSFHQFPLRLAWAVSIHKSQGLTFKRMAIDAAKSFAAGQVYVALSRATTLQGIYLQSPLTPQAIKVNKRVEQFYNKERPVAPLEQFVATKKQSYVIETLHNLFSTSTCMKALLRAKTLLLQLPLSESAVANDWLGDCKLLMDELQASIHSKGDLLHEAIDKMFDEKGLAQLNSLLQENVPDWVAQCSPQLMKLQQQLQSLCKSGSLYSNEEIIASLLSVHHCQQKQLSSMARLAKGYHELDFFARVNIETASKEKTIANNAIDKKEADEALEFPVELFEELKDCVRKIAKEENVPVYVVTAYKPLEWVAAYLPQNVEQLERLPGFGKTKSKKYGHQILEVVQQWKEMHPKHVPTPMQHLPKKKKR